MRSWRVLTGVEAAAELALDDLEGLQATRVLGEEVGLRDLGRRPRRVCRGLGSDRVRELVRALADVGARLEPIVEGLRQRASRA